MGCTSYKSVCCFSLKTGSLIIGYLQLISQICFLGIFDLNKYSFHYYYRSEYYPYYNYLDYYYENDEINYNIAKNISDSLTVVCLVFTMSMLYGVYTSKPIFIASWLVFSGIILILDVLLPIICFMIFITVHDKNYIYLILAIILVFLWVWMWFIFISVYSYYKELNSIKNNVAVPMNDVVIQPVQQPLHGYFDANFANIVPPQIPSRHNSYSNAQQPHMPRRNYRAF